MAPKTKENRETRAGCVSHGTGNRSWKMNTRERVTANMTMKVKSMVRSGDRSVAGLEEGESGEDCCGAPLVGVDVGADGVDEIVEAVLVEALEDPSLSDGSGMRSRMERLITISIVCVLFSFAMSWN